MQQINNNINKLIISLEKYNNSLIEKENKPIKIRKTKMPDEERKKKSNEKVKKWVEGRKHHCEICNKTMSYMSKSDHSRSKKHLKKIEEANKPPQEPVPENTI